MPGMSDEMMSTPTKIGASENGTGNPRDIGPPVENLGVNGKGGEQPGDDSGAGKAEESDNGTGFGQDVEPAPPLTERVRTEVRNGVDKVKGWGETVLGWLKQPRNENQGSQDEGEALDSAPTEDGIGDGAMNQEQLQIAEEMEDVVERTDTSLEQIADELEENLEKLGIDEDDWLAMVSERGVWDQVNSFLDGVVGEGSDVRRQIGLARQALEGRVEEIRERRAENRELSADYRVSKWMESKLGLVNQLVDEVGNEGYKVQWALVKGSDVEGAMRQVEGMSESRAEAKGALMKVLRKREAIDEVDGWRQMLGGDGAKIKLALLNGENTDWAIDRVNQVQASGVDEMDLSRLDVVKRELAEAARTSESAVAGAMEDLGRRGVNTEVISKALESGEHVEAALEIVNESGGGASEGLLAEMLRDKRAEGVVELAASERTIDVMVDLDEMEAQWAKGQFGEVERICAGLSVDPGMIREAIASGENMEAALELVDDMAGRGLPEQDVAKLRGMLEKRQMLDLADRLEESLGNDYVAVKGALLTGEGMEGAMKVLLDAKEKGALSDEELGKLEMSINEKVKEREAEVALLDRVANAAEAKALEILQTVGDRNLRELPPEMAEKAVEGLQGALKSLKEGGLLERGKKSLKYAAIFMLIMTLLAGFVSFKGIQAMAGGSPSR